MGAQSSRARDDRGHACRSPQADQPSSPEPAPTNPRPDRLAGGLGQKAPSVLPTCRGWAGPLSHLPRGRYGHLSQLALRAHRSPPGDGRGGTEAPIEAAAVVTDADRAGDRGRDHRLAQGADRPRHRRGAHAIHYHLQQRHRRHRRAVPSVATIWRVLSRRGFVNPQPRSGMSRDTRPGCLATQHRGGGGNRTRVLQLLYQASPSAAGGRLSGGRTSPALGDRRSQLGVPPGPLTRPGGEPHLMTSGSAPQGWERVDVALAT